MPGWACPRTRPRPWSWATTRCGSTRRWPRRAMRWRWPRRLPWRSTPAAWRLPPSRSSRATWRRRRLRCSARRRWETDMIDPFYPVVPDSNWVARLVPAGAKFVQLRIKDKPDAELRRQVREARDVCAKHGADLIVNDYWQIAI